MKKFGIALLRASVLLLSFSAIALAVIMRKEIGTALMSATILVAVILIIIVIVLLIGDEPSQSPKRPTMKMADFTIEDDLPEVKQIKKVKEVKEIKQVTTKTTSGKRKWRMVESGDILLVDQKTTTTQTEVQMKQNDPGPVKEQVLTPLTPKVEQGLNTTFANPYLIQIELTDTHQENLVSLIEDMEFRRFIQRNPDYDNCDLLPKGVKYYQSNYKDIPIITIMKQRHQRHKVMAGCDTATLYEIALFEEKDYDLISTLYNNSQHMQGIISGGRYRIVDLDSGELSEMIEPQSVQLRIYHGLS